MRPANGLAEAARGRATQTRDLPDPIRWPQLARQVRTSSGYTEAPALAPNGRQFWTPSAPAALTTPRQSAQPAAAPAIGPAVRRLSERAARLLEYVRDTHKAWAGLPSATSIAMDLGFPAANLVVHAFRELEAAGELVCVTFDQNGTAHRWVRLPDGREVMTRRFPRAKLDALRAQVGA